MRKSWLSDQQTTVVVKVFLSDGFSCSTAVLEDLTSGRKVGEGDVTHHLSYRGVGVLEDSIHGSKETTNKILRSFHKIKLKPLHEVHKELVMNDGHEGLIESWHKSLGSFQHCHLLLGYSLAVGCTFLHKLPDGR
ncbi:hypothetical protein E2C01_064642 [Portunus trituberculatus]|uniref:Uncharacterized protein n=1 Tax=Portunus trituberculatus TaxID=210409 RepID=A0A5B7HLD2_PORTR|nr:hypothetical protein [Portunus trituberculatus]